LVRVTDSIAVPAPAPGVAPSRLGQRVRRYASAPLIAVLAGVAGQIAIRLALYWNRSGPLIYPDEAGYLLGARVLAGGPPVDLSGLTSYQGGYPLLLAPLYLVSQDPEIVYRLVMGVNAVVGAALFPLGGLALMRCGVRREQAFALAWAAAFLPATTIYGGLAMADAVLPVVVLAWLLTLDRFVASGRPAPAVAASALAAYAYSIHLRGAVVLLVHAAVLIFFLVRGGDARRTAGGALGLTAVAAASVAVLNGLLAAKLYPAGTRELGTILVDRMTSLDGQVRALTGAVGQVWAMMTGTWGLGALGLVALAAVVVRRGAREDRIMAGVVLATTAGIGYASSAALPNEFRVGNFAYGRYASCVALVFALAGAAWLVRGRSGRSVLRGLAAAAALVGGAGLWLVGYLGERLDTYEIYPWDVPEIGLLGGGYLVFRPVVISAAACALLILLWALSRWAFGALVIGLLTVNLVLTWLPLTVWQVIEDMAPAPRLPGPPTGGVAVARVVPGVDHPGPDVAHPVPELIYSRTARQAWWTELVRFDLERGLPHPGICQAVVFWPAGVPAADTWPRHPPGWLYQRAGTLGALTWVVWYDPSCAG
jgi:hypothetical protein